MAKTKKPTKNEAAIQWLVTEGDKAMQRKDTVAIDAIIHIMKTLRKPDYEKEIKAVGKYLQINYSISFSRFRKIVSNPTAKPKTINHK